MIHPVDQQKFLQGSGAGTQSVAHSAATSHLENDSYMADFESILRLHEPGEPSPSRHAFNAFHLTSSQVMSEGLILETSHTFS